MKFQIIEKLKDDIEESKNIMKYDTKIYIGDNPVKMTVEIKDSCKWAYQNSKSYTIRLISLIDSEIEAEEYFSTFSSAITRFNEIKEQYGKQEN